MEFENPNEIPQAILQEASNAEQLLIPSKSKETYEKEYQKFVEWMTAEKINSPNEKVVLAYLSLQVMIDIGI